jgi:hypothetical protein
VIWRNRSRCLTCLPLLAFMEATFDRYESKLNYPDNINANLPRTALCFHCMQCKEHINGELSQNMSVLNLCSPHVSYCPLEGQMFVGCAYKPGSVCIYYACIFIRPLSYSNSERFRVDYPEENCYWAGLFTGSWHVYVKGRIVPHSADGE